MSLGTSRQVKTRSKQNFSLLFASKKGSEWLIKDSTEKLIHFRSIVSHIQFICETRKTDASGDQEKRKFPIKIKTEAINQVIDFCLP